MAQKLKKRAEKKLDSNNDTNRSGTPIGRGCRGRGRKRWFHSDESQTRTS